MAQASDQSDAAFRIVTDALRAGPGTPQWEAALERMRDAHPRDANEYALLYAAREDLARGRRYREIQPGPNFTRKVFAAIEEERSGARRRPSPATLIAALSAITIVALLVVAGYVLLRSGSVTQPPRRVEDLAQIAFVDTAVVSTFQQPEPAGKWKTAGALPLEFSRGVRPGAAATSGDDYIGGAVQWAEPIAPHQPIAASIILRLPRPNDDVIPQVFITDDAAFDPQRATTPHELVWLFRAGEASVILPSGRVAGETIKLKEGTARVEVQVRLNRDQIIVETGGRRLYSGEHGLRRDRPRYLGVRFLSREEKLTDPPAVQSIRVQTPRSSS